jgi:hypothetical protein
MPARYEAIRDSLVKKGMSLKAAKSKAARIYQGTRQQGEPELNHYVAQERRGFRPKGNPFR